VERTLPRIGVRTRTIPDRPPAAFWLLPAVIALLRVLPYHASLALDPPPGKVALQIGYLPKDTLAYLAFIRQAAEDGSFLLANPFTTEAQTPRFVLLLHWLLGVASRTIGMSPSQVLELARVPLIFTFFFVLWGFLRPILPERRTRLIGCALVGLAGGVDWMVEPLLGLLHPGVAMELSRATQDVFGWSTFEALFNSLWIAGLTLLMIALGPVLAPRGPERARDYAAIGVGFLLLFVVHPYSAMVAAAVAATAAIADVVLHGARVWRRHARVALAFAPAVVLVLLLARWQAGDAVYRATSGGLLGPEALSPFWYPLTLGATLLLALRGARIWLNEAHPYALGVLAWIGVVVWLHSSPVLNGYHFLLYLHLPLCILAASALDRAWSLHRSFGAPQWAGVALLAVALFAAPVATTARAVADVARHDLFPADYGDVIVDLAARPAGNAIVPPSLGNLLPAYTPHRVWVGHWFMTPDRPQRAARYARWTSDPADAAALDDMREVVRAQAIAYVVVPAGAAPAVAGALGDRVIERRPHGALELLILDRASARADS
jgi:hypothetical protein